VSVCKMSKKGTDFDDTFKKEWLHARDKSTRIQIDVHRGSFSAIPYY